MSEPERDSVDDAPASDGAPPANLPVKRNRSRRSLIAVATVGAVIGLLQWTAPNFDHQIANLLSMALVALLVIYLAYQAHRTSSAAGHRWRVPVAVAGLIGILVLLFEPDGYSGEMVPQFRYRFGQRHELKAVNGEESVGKAGSAESLALADSPQFLGPNRNGVIDQRKFALPSSPDQVRVLWDQGIGKGWASFAIAGDRAVTLEQRDDLECVTCYRLADGELLWMQSHEAYHAHSLGGAGPRTTPCIQGGRVFAQGSTGFVWCLNLETGEPLWTVDLLKMAGWEQLESDTAIAWGRAGSPVVVDGLCIVPFGTPVDLQNPNRGSRSLIALDAATGEVRWKAGSDQISYASPVVMELAGQRQIVSVNEKTITGHLIDSGNVLWSFDWLGASNSNANCTMAVPAGEDRFLIGKGYGGGSALVELSNDNSNGFSAEAVWQSYRVLKTKFTHACVDGDVAYALSDGSLQAVSLNEGERLWMQPRSARFGQGQILLIDDVIVAQAEAGDLAFVRANPDRYDELLRIPALDFKTWNIPTVAGRHLLVRNDRQAICYLLPAKK